MPVQDVTLTKTDILLIILTKSNFSYIGNLIYISVPNIHKMKWLDKLPS